MQHQYGVCVDPNKKFRKSMEDAHTVLTPFEATGSYFAIFDGHAGTASAVQSADQLHKIFEAQLGTEANVVQALRNSFVDMDSQLKDVKNSGCTACVAYIKDKSLYVANVGDTRAVLGRNAKALRLSYDHRGADENERKRITNMGGLLINNRVNGVLAVTRALGDLYMKDYVVSEPYTTETQLQPQDEVLIVACDGVWDVFSDQQAIDLVWGKDPQTAADELVTTALERGSMDNLTAMVISL